MNRRYATNILFTKKINTKYKEEPQIQIYYGKATNALICTLSGLSIFIAGFLINLDSDKRLRQLRSSSEGVLPGKKTYGIPRGGLFEYVSAANYFGEIVEWTGFAIASGHVAALLFAVSSGVFLTIRGVQHHRYRFSIIIVQLLDLTFECS